MAPGESRVTSRLVHYTRSGCAVDHPFHDIGFIKSFLKQRVMVENGSKFL